MTDKTPKQLALEATAAAKAALIAENEDRFRELKRREYEARGLEFPQTPEEKAEAQARELLAKHPDVLYRVVNENMKSTAQFVGGKKVKDATYMKDSPDVQDVVPDLPPVDPAQTDDAIHRAVQQFTNDEPPVDDDIDLPEGHGITPPNQNPDDPWSAPAADSEQAAIARGEVGS